MSRQERPAIAGGIFHVMNRGNRKMPIFEDDRARRRFLRILIEEKNRYGVTVKAGCQMGNHFHLVVGTPHANLSDFMEQLQGRFARYSNWRYGRVGHLFQGRFRHVVIEHDTHLLIALCYVFLNPVSGRLVTRPEDYKWSTYAATVGLAPSLPYLTCDWLQYLFPGDALHQSQQRLRHLISQASPVVAYLRQDMTAVEPEAVRRVLRSYVGAHLRLGTLPQTYRSALRSPLTQLVQPAMAPLARAAAIHDAHVVNGYSLAEIAREMGLSRQTVSKVFRSAGKPQ